MKCAAAIAKAISPFAEKRRYYSKHLDEVLDILKDGEKRARVVAAETMQDVRKAMSLG